MNSRVDGEETAEAGSWCHTASRPGASASLKRRPGPSATHRTTIPRARACCKSHPCYVDVSRPGALMMLLPASERCLPTIRAPSTPVWLPGRVPRLALVHEDRAGRVDARRRCTLGRPQAAMAAIRTTTRKRPRRKERLWAGVATCCAPTRASGRWPEHWRRQWPGARSPCPSPKGHGARRWPRAARASLRP